MLKRFAYIMKHRTKKKNTMQVLINLGNLVNEKKTIEKYKCILRRYTLLHLMKICLHFYIKLSQKRKEGTVDVISGDPLYKSPFSDRK